MQIVSSFFVSQKKEAPRSSSEAKKVLLEPFQRRLLRIKLIVGINLEALIRKPQLKIVSGQGTELV